MYVGFLRLSNFCLSSSLSNINLISPKFISKLIHRKSFRIAIEGTGLRGNRLIKRILLMTIADSSAIFQGTEMSEKG
jgi:hypothetical protein